MNIRTASRVTASGGRLGWLCLLAAIVGGCHANDSAGPAGSRRDGSPRHPLVVMLVPSESGQSSVKDDFAPLFDAVTRVDGIAFDLKMGSSYAAVVEGMKAGQLDIAFYGAVSYQMAHKAGAAELLGVGVQDGQATYYSGIFHRAGSGMKGIKDLRGKVLAVGDVNSTSSFNYPMAMLIEAGLDPVKDLRGIVMAGSHSASLAAIQAGQVDAGAASLNAYEKMVREGNLDGTKVVLLVKSDPIPNPVLAMWTGLPPAVKERLKAAFGQIHTQPGVKPEMILGYGGKRADRYDTTIDDAFVAPALARLAGVSDSLREEIVRFANQSRK